MEEDEEEILDLTLDEGEAELDHTIHSLNPQPSAPMDTGDSRSEGEMDEEMEDLLRKILPEALMAMGNIPTAGHIPSSTQSTGENLNPNSRVDSSPLSTIQDGFGNLTPEIWAELKEALKRNAHEQIMFWETILQMLE